MQKPKYTYESATEAAKEKDIAKAFFKSKIAEAVADLPVALRPYADDRMTNITVEFIGDYSPHSRKHGRRCFFMLIIHAKPGKTYGYTKIKLRSNGTINEENLYAAVSTYCGRKFRAERAAISLEVNKEAASDIPERVRKNLVPTCKLGYFRLSYRRAGIGFGEDVKAADVVSIFDILEKAAAEIEALKGVNDVSRSVPASKGDS